MAIALGWVAAVADGATAAIACLISALPPLLWALRVPGRRLAASPAIEPDTTLAKAQRPRVVANSSADARIDAPAIVIRDVFGDVQIVPRRRGVANKTVEARP